MNISVLKNFILSQGASRRIITMEWDKFWAENKRFLEEVAPRYMAVNDPSKPRGAVPFLVTNFADLYGDVQEVAATAPLHPQKPELGTRVMRRATQLLLDPEDCGALTEGEEVTLLRWGNFIIEKIVRDEAGTVLSVSARHDPDAKNFSKTRKLTWLASTPDAVQCTLVEFDHLISKAKLGDDEDFKDFVNPRTRAEVSSACSSSDLTTVNLCLQTFAIGDPCLRTITPGQIIQLERRGFFRCDVAYGGPSKPIVLFYIPGE